MEATDIDEWGYWEEGLTEEEYFKKYPRNKEDEINAETE